MYEKDEDEGNVGFQFKMAREVFKSKPITYVGGDPITTFGGAGPMHSLPAVGAGMARVHSLVDAGASQFESHEDVMAKLLGKV